MKKIKLDEKFEQRFDSFFDENDFANQQISIFQNESALKNPTNSQNEIFLDKFLSAIKFIFLFIPGVISIHLVGMVLKVIILFEQTIFTLSPELTGFAVIGTFLTMMGMGKLRDLSYLKVPAAIFAMSVLLTLIHTFVWLFDGGKSEGLFWLISFPIVIVWGYIVKRFLDKD